MGMYDIVNVSCPKCGTKEEFQSKGGTCTLREYTLDTAPVDVLSDINRHSPYTCRNCSTQFAVKVTSFAIPIIVKGE
jgi:DNA-directed RNA polymerase subunit RPC12/RpoP